MEEVTRSLETSNWMPTDRKLMTQCVLAMSVRLRSMTVPNIASMSGKEHIYRANTKSREGILWVLNVTWSKF